MYIVMPLQQESEMDFFLQREKEVNGEGWKVNSEWWKVNGELRIENELSEMVRWRDGFFTKREREKEIKLRMENWEWEIENGEWTVNEECKSGVICALITFTL